MDFIENNLALLIISVSIIVVERVVKFYITENLQRGQYVPVIGNALMITRSENIGAGFGILRGQNWLFVSAAVIVLLLIIYFYNTIIYDRLLVFATAFILGGAVGNMMDRLFFGRVIDYITMYFWPTFNLSDVALVIGVFLLLVYMYRWQKEPSKKERYTRY
jgi:signal peptidase II